MRGDKFHLSEVCVLEFEIYLNILYNKAHCFERSLSFSCGTWMNAIIKCEKNKAMHAICCCCCSLSLSLPHPIIIITILFSLFLLFKEHSRIGNWNRKITPQIEYRTVAKDNLYKNNDKVRKMKRKSSMKERRTRANVIANNRQSINRIINYFDIK